METNLARTLCEGRTIRKVMGGNERIFFQVHCLCKIFLSGSSSLHDYYYYFFFFGGGGGEGVKLSTVAVLILTLCKI